MIDLVERIRNRFPNYIEAFAIAADEITRLTARVAELEAALAVRPLKPRHRPEKLRQMTGEDGYHRGWQEALTALGNARAAIRKERAE